VEGVVDFRRGELLGVKRKHLRRRQIFGIKVPLPLRVLKSRGADPKVHKVQAKTVRCAKARFKRKPPCTNVRSTERFRIGCSGKSFYCRNSTRGKHEKIVLSIALACVAPFSWGQISETTTTTTTTTTDANGTITEYTPGSMIVLKETSGPRHYRFGKTVTYVTRSGKVLDEDVVRTRVKVGVPVRVHYTGSGDAMMVDRVILDED
jgi:hypothetical protein